MKGFLAALFPHAFAVSVGAVVGALIGLVFDVHALLDGGLGPASAHAGAFVLFFLAAVPAFLALVGAIGSLALSLVVTLLWDGVRRRFRRRTLVRLTTLLCGAWPWFDVLSNPPGDFSVFHFIVLALLSLACAALGLGAGLVLVLVLPRRLTGGGRLRA